MKRIIFRIAVLSALALAGTAWAEKDMEEPQVRLELQLVDGSRIIGIPGITSVPLQTSYAKIAVPLNQILTIRINEDHETASLDLRSSDKLKGVINLEPIKLETVFGKISVGIEHIKQIGVRLGDAEDGLFLRYSFDRDEGDKVADKSGHGNDGTVYQATWKADGKVGGAYDFSATGTSRVEFDWSSLNGARELTAMAWIRSSGDPGHWEMVLGGTPTSPTMEVCLLWFNKRGLGDNASAGLWVRDEKSNKDEHVDINFSRTVSSFRDGNWHHLAMTWDGKEAAYYIDAKKESNRSTPQGALVVTGRGVIGTGQGWNQLMHNFNGMIDEVMIYKRALTETEVTQIYDAQK